MPKCDGCGLLYEPFEAVSHRFCILNSGGAYTKILEAWPPSLRESFEDFVKKFWAGPGQHFDYNDNYRVARVGNAAEEAIYETARDAGCCGSNNRVIELEGVKIKFGFNYGH